MDSCWAHVATLSWASCMADLEGTSFEQGVRSCRGRLVKSSFELVRPALLLGPDVGVSGCVLLKDSKVGASLKCSMSDSSVCVI